MDRLAVLHALVPGEPDWKIDWSALQKTPLAEYIEKMGRTRQNPLWHREGDVWTHTRMVCEELTAEASFRKLPEEKRLPLFWAALLHDIGKIPCTTQQEGLWISPGHTLVGAKMARELLWRDFGLCGTKEYQNVRECICTLIRNHSIPLHILEQDNPEQRLLRIASQGELSEDFSLHLLKLLVRADVCGRISEDKDKSLELLELCFFMAEELNIMEAPFSFPSPVTEYACLSGKNVWREQELYDDSWGEVILMSGLPGTGKDTWIQANCPNLPMVSLDRIREQMGVSPEENQGKVIQEALRQAKEYLRRCEPFVWNATDTTLKIRQKQCNLFEQYGARTRIVFLETGWETGLRRNAGRRKEVPLPVLEKLLRHLEPPERWEGRRVDWFCL